jgi:hypothetical protein
VFLHNQTMLGKDTGVTISSGRATNPNMQNPRCIHWFATGVDCVEATVKVGSTSVRSKPKKTISGKLAVAMWVK